MRCASTAAISPWDISSSARTTRVRSLTEEHLHRACGYTLRNPVRHGFVERAEEWEWSSFRSSARLAPPARAHLACEAFDRMLGLAGDGRPLETLRAYVREPELATAMIRA